MSIKQLPPRRTIASADDLTWFWAIIDRTTGEDFDAQIEALRSGLAALSDQDLVDFIHLFNGQQNALYSWRLWAAAYVINGGCSDDGFIDFRSWLISRGRAVTEAAFRDPDSLAALNLEMDTATFEDFAYVMLDVFRERAGGDYPELPGEGQRSEPDDPDWGFDFEDEPQIRARLPRLAEQFLT